MDLRQLEMFKAVADLGGFSRAGEKLHVSHSAIIRQITLLEEELHSSLFLRANKRVSLTEAGRALLGHVGPIFELLAQAVDSVSRVSQSGVGHLDLGSGTTILNYFLPPVFAEFNRRYPAMPVHVRTGQWLTILEDIRGGLLDVAIGSVPLPIEGRDFLIRPLYREELVAVVGNCHPFAKTKLIRPGELNDLPLITFSPNSTTRRILEQVFQELKISPRVQLEVENDEAVEKAITAGTGISFMGKPRASRDRIHFLRISGRQIFRDTALVSLRSKKAFEHLAYFSALCYDHAKRTFGPDCLCA